MNERNPHFPSTLTEWGGGILLFSAYLFLSSYIFPLLHVSAATRKGALKRGGGGKKGCLGPPEKSSVRKAYSVYNM